MAFGKGIKTDFGGILYRPAEGDEESFDKPGQDIERGIICEMKRQSQDRKMSN